MPEATSLIGSGIGATNVLAGSGNPYSFLLNTAMKYLPFEQNAFTGSLQGITSMYGTGSTLGGLAGAGSAALMGGLAEGATATAGTAGFGMAEGAGAAGVIGAETGLSSTLAALSEILGPLGILAGIGMLVYGNLSSRRRRHHAMDDYQNKFNPAVQQAFGGWGKDPEKEIAKLYRPEEDEVLTDKQSQYLAAAYMNKLARVIGESKYTDREKEALMGALAQKFSNSLNAAKAAGGKMSDYEAAGLKWITVPIEAQKKAMLDAIGKLPAPFGRSLGDWTTVDRAKNALSGPGQWLTPLQMQEMDATGKVEGITVDPMMYRYQKWVEAGKPIPRHSNYAWNKLVYQNPLYSQFGTYKLADFQNIDATTAVNKYGLNSIDLYAQMMKDQSNEQAKYNFYRSIGKTGYDKSWESNQRSQDYVDPVTGARAIHAPLPGPAPTTVPTTPPPGGYQPMQGVQVTGGVYTPGSLSPATAVPNPLVPV